MHNNTYASNDWWIVRGKVSRDVYSRLSDRQESSTRNFYPVFRRLISRMLSQGGLEAARAFRREKGVVQSNRYRVCILQRIIEHGRAFMNDAWRNVGLRELFFYPKGALPVICFSLTRRSLLFFFLSGHMQGKLRDFGTCWFYLNLQRCKRSLSPAWRRGFAWKYRIVLVDDLADTFRFLLFVAWRVLIVPLPLTFSLLLPLFLVRGRSIYRAKPTTGSS